MGQRTSSPSSTLAPGSRTTQSSSRWWWYWLERMPPGSTVMILTVQGTLWAYCSNLPQGLSTFTEGGLSPKYISSPISGQFKPSVRFWGDYASKPARFDLAQPLLTRHTALRTSVVYDARRK